MLLVIKSNYVVPVFQGGDLCGIMEKGPHKTICIIGFVRISNVGCNPFKLWGDLYEIIEKGPQKTYWLSGFVKVSKFVACNQYKLCGPRFPRGDLCEIMEKL